MSLATAYPSTPRSLAVAPALTADRELASAPLTADSRSRPIAATPARTSEPSVGVAGQRRLHAVPNAAEARGFVLYVGLDEAKAAAAGTTLGAVVEQLKALAAQLVPSSDTYAAVALAPAGAGGRDVDVVRLALQDPAALATHRQAPGPTEPQRRLGIVIDLSRKRLQLDEETAPLTYKEFELLQYLVLREGRTVDRAGLIAGLWSASDAEIPNERTIDVHVRRLRSKLGAYEDIVRTVRGEGYRFDRHADVSIRYASTPSPDLY